MASERTSVECSCQSTPERNASTFRCDCPVHRDGAVVVPPPSDLREIGDPAAFWSSLTPAQALALLRAAPKVAGPWFDTEHGSIRPGVAEGRWAAVVTPPSRFEARYTFRVDGDDGWTTFAQSLDAAKAEADETLRQDGWVLA